MATTENAETCSPENKGGHHGSADPDTQCPKKVQYFGSKNYWAFSELAPYSLFFTDLPVAAGCDRAWARTQSLSWHSWRCSIAPLTTGEAQWHPILVIYTCSWPILKTLICGIIWLSRSTTSVVGFPVCSLPTEYCEYMPEPSKCRQWLEKNFPGVFARMSVVEYHQTVGNPPLPFVLLSNVKLLEK